MRSVAQNLIKHKVGLLNLAAELGNVSKACKVMGFSRDTFYRYQAAVESGGVDALIDANRRKPNLRNRVDEAIESAVKDFALEQPAYGQVRCRTNCVSAASSSLPLASAQSSCAVIWSHLSSDCSIWSAMWRPPEKC